MTENAAVITIECDPAAGEALEDKLKSVASGEVVVVSRNNLDGSLATILLVTQIVSTALGAVTPLLALFLKRREVRRVTIRSKNGALEILSPTEAELGRVLREHAGQPGGA